MKPSIGINTKDFAGVLLNFGMLLDGFEQGEKP